MGLIGQTGYFLFSKQSCCFFFTSIKQCTPSLHRPLNQSQTVMFSRQPIIHKLSTFEYALSLSAVIQLSSRCGTIFSRPTPHATSIPGPLATSNQILPSDVPVTKLSDQRAPPLRTAIVSGPGEVCSIPEAPTPSNSFSLVIYFLPASTWQRLTLFT